MKKTIKTRSILFAVMTLCLLALSGCGTPSVNLNDYVVVTSNGNDGGGTLSISLEFGNIALDNMNYLRKNMDMQGFEGQPPEMAAQLAFMQYDPFELDYEPRAGLKNGDTVQFSWKVSDDALQQLEKVLKLKFKCSDFSYKVKGLSALREVDPFEELDIIALGESGKGSIKSICAFIPLENGEELPVWVDVNGSTDDLSNGDQISISISSDENDTRFYSEEYGICFTRTSCDITLDCFSYVPEGEEVFTLLREEDLAAVTESYTNLIRSADSAPNAESRTVKLAGMVYYYDYIGDGNPYDQRSQLVFFFHIEDGAVPGGWYSYYAPNTESIIWRTFTYTDSIRVEHHTYSGTRYHGFTNSGFYKREGMRVNYPRSSNAEHSFTWNDSSFTGHRTLQEAVTAFEETYFPADCYRHTLTYGECVGTTAIR